MSAIKISEIPEEVDVGNVSSLKDVMAKEW